MKARIDKTIDDHLLSIVSLRSVVYVYVCLTFPPSSDTNCVGVYESVFAYRYRESTNGSV